MLISRLCMFSFMHLITHEPRHKKPDLCIPNESYLVGNPKYRFTRDETRSRGLIYYLP